jgi:hypothetical protein
VRLDEVEQQRAQAHTDRAVVGMDQAHNQLSIEQFVFVPVPGERFQIIVRPNSLSRRARRRWHTKAS